MTSAFVLFIYLATYSSQSGMATASQEFNSLQKCETAGRAVKEQFGGIYTNVYWFCIEK